MRKPKPSIDDYIPIYREGGSMGFETYGDDLAFVKSQNLNHTWTLLDDDNGIPIIVAGYRFVNRINYIITIKPWTDENVWFKYVD